MADLIQITALGDIVDASATAHSRAVDLVAGAGGAGPLSAYTQARAYARACDAAHRAAVAAYVAAGGQARPHGSSILRDALWARDRAVA